MRKLLYALLLAALAPLVGSAQEPQADSVQKAKSFKREIKATVGAEYLLYLPADYDAKSGKKWPLMLFLHGAGERGTNIWQVAVHGPPKIVREKKDFPFIVVSPQCPPGQRWDNNTLLGLLDEVIGSHAVDTNRVYLTGLSMGGYGTWSLGLAYPEKFAAIAPICGGGDPIAVYLGDARKAAALKSLPIWVFHGAKDSVVRLQESERMVEAVKRVGNQGVKFTIYPEAEHDSWTETYNNPELYKWLLEHKR